ncbi:rhodanese-like domain-containing protein [Neisseria sp.]|uniref:rhodanese-like domain-containing protein n=1 Tax=Neisseria sp. TaxID=192066 RepID=UPI0026DC9095|nr:rhodanese-like domain-containing protein [Neisseria sp.]MDO4906230.1 rhodanese-like domain-containing protein [Neisseria sp.]
MQKAVFITFAALAAAFAAAAPSAAPNSSTAAQSAVRPAKAAGIWIDVRSPEEYRQGHLQGALNIPADKIGAEIAAASPDKNAPVNLYCRSGRRAEAALQVLKKMGYTNVTNHGGYDDLIRQGLK